MKRSDMEIPIFEDVTSVQPGSKGRVMEYTFEELEKRQFIHWPEEYKRKYKPLRDPDDNHILTDDEIDNLINAINHGWQESAFLGIRQFKKYLTYRQQIPEDQYGMFSTDVSVVRFFTNTNRGDAKENILADIKALNEKENMGNIKIPGTSVELINYSPCPKCGHIHSYNDIYNYYLHPVPDPNYKSKGLQYMYDTRVMCVECKSYFLPALIVVDGDPKNEHQMICRRQTVTEVVSFMDRTYNERVLYMKKENIITHKESGKKSWRNDVDAKLLKSKQGLFTNFLSYTPAPQIINFIMRKNLKIEEPLYGQWLPPEQIWYRP